MFLPTSVIMVALSANQTLITQTTMPPPTTDVATMVALDPKASVIDLVIESLLPNLPIISHSQAQATSIAEPTVAISSDHLFLPSSTPTPRTKINVAPPPGEMWHGPYLPPAAFTPEVFDPYLPSLTLTPSVKAIVALPHGGMWHGPHVTGASFTPKAFDPNSDLTFSIPNPSVQATIAPRGGPMLHVPCSSMTPSVPATTNLLRGGMWYGPHRASNLSSSSTLPTPPPPPPLVKPPLPPQLPHRPLSPRNPYHRPSPLPPFANLSTTHHHPITPPPPPPLTNVNSTYTLLANFPINTSTTCSSPFTTYDLLASPDTCYPLTRYHHDVIGVRWGTGAGAMRCGLRLYRNQNCTGDLWGGGGNGLEDWRPEEMMDRGGWGCRSMRAFGGPWGSVRGERC